MSSLKTFLNAHIGEKSALRFVYYRIVAVLAAFYYRFPSRHLKVIAVTGTNGKTTTVTMIADILAAAGYRVGVMSSIAFRIADRVWENDLKQTTVGRFMMQRLLRDMLNSRCEYVVIEVTSHAMIQSRLWGVNVDIAVLTTISEDHIEYHGGFEEYLRAKLLLFQQLVRSDRKPWIQKIGVINRDQPVTLPFQQLGYDRLFTYGMHGKGTVFASDIVFRPNNTEFVFNLPNRKVKVALPLIGSVNVMNAVAAGAAAIAVGVDVDMVVRALGRIKGIPGRVESIDEGQDYRIVVDYAHTPNAIEELCKTFKPITAGRLIVVFGATGGGRDRSKRPVMGSTAHRYADVIILTDDDPYFDNRNEIIDQIASGIPRSEGDNFWMIKHRRQAIYFALNSAEAGDTVLILGKGCEPVQIIGDSWISWDDRKIVRSILNRKVAVDL